MWGSRTRVLPLGRRAVSKSSQDVSYSFCFCGPHHSGINEWELKQSISSLGSTWSIILGASCSIQSSIPSVYIASSVISSRATTWSLISSLRPPPASRYSVAFYAFDNSGRATSAPASPLSLEEENVPTPEVRKRLLLSPLHLVHVIKSNICVDSQSSPPGFAEI